MIRHMDMESISISMDPSLKANGLMINRTAMVSKLGLMEQAIRAHTWTERSMAKGFLSGQTTRITKALSTRMISMGMASTSGQMEEFSKESGNITR